MTDELQGFKPDSDDPSAQELMLQETMHKLRKKIPESTVEELEELDEAGLRSRIAQCEVSIHESEQARLTDKQLAAWKEKVKEANAPYNDVKNAQNSIARYCACRLDELGKT